MNGTMDWKGGNTNKSVFNDKGVFIEEIKELEK